MKLSQVRTMIRNRKMLEVQTSKRSGWLLRGASHTFARSRPVTAAAVAGVTDYCIVFDACTSSRRVASVACITMSASLVSSAPRSTSPEADRKRRRVFLSDTHLQIVAFSCI